MTLNVTALCFAPQCAFWRRVRVPAVRAGGAGHTQAGGREGLGRGYLSAVQVQTLASDLQLEDFYLIIPLLLNRGVPDVSSVQTWFDPTQDLGRKTFTGMRQKKTCRETASYTEQRALTRRTPLRSALSLGCDVTKRICVLENYMGTFWGHACTGGRTTPRSNRAALVVPLT